MNPDTPHSELSESSAASAGHWLTRHRHLIIVLVGALLLRLAIAAKLNPSHGDQEEYLSGARRLLDGEPLPILNNMLFVRSPAYSVFVAAIWKITQGRSLLSIKVVQVFLSTATCWITYLLALRIRDDRRVALIAACVAALYPYFLFEVATTGTECVFGFLVVLGSYFFARALDKERIHWGYFSAGVGVYAIGILVRPNLGPPEALLGLMLAWRYRHRVRTVLGAASIMVAGTLLILTPWSIAVARQGLGWIFSSDGGAAWYYVGHCDFALRVYCEHTEGRERAAIIGSSWELDPVLFVVHTLPRSEQARYFRNTALRWDAEHLAEQPCLAVGKLWSYWRPWVEPHVYSRAQFAISLLSLPLLGLGLVGLWKLRSAAASGPASVVGANLLAGTITAVVYSTQIRYRIPVVDALLVPYAAYMGREVFRRAATQPRAKAGS